MAAFVRLHAQKMTAEICPVQLIVMPHGQSSPPFGGQQRFNLDRVIFHPLRKPCFRRATIAYSEQLGSNLQDCRTEVGAISL